MQIVDSLPRKSQPAARKQTRSGTRSTRISKQTASRPRSAKRRRVSLADHTDDGKPETSASAPTPVADNTSHGAKVHIFCPI
jgi:hypothetical protein